MSEIEFKSRINFDELNTFVSHIKYNIGQVIVGQEDLVENMIVAMLADGHILLEGVPGVAKTLSARMLAKSIETNFSRIQFTPDLMPSDIIGTSIFLPGKSEFEFRKGPIFSNIVLIDEINRSPAKTQAALFEVMEEKQITNDGVCYTMDFPFLVIATQNPVEQEGTYRLPEAQLDRFLFKLIVDYPELIDEIRILKRENSGELKKNQDLVPVISAKMLGSVRTAVSNVLIEDNLIEYIAKIVHMTRNHVAFSLGASPRASIALIRASKALAAISGRDFVSPDDIKKLALPILRHRVMLTPEKEMDGTSPDTIICQIIEEIEVPR